jgi:hypothetical protein
MVRGRGGLRFVAEENEVVVWHWHQWYGEYRGRIHHVMHVVVRGGREIEVCVEVVAILHVVLGNGEVLGDDFVIEPEVDRRGAELPHPAVRV